MTKLKESDSLWLEKLIDKNGLPAVLEELSDIAHGKAQHIQESWQDEALAKLWRRVGTVLDRVADNKNIKELP